MKKVGLLLLLLSEWAYQPVEGRQRSSFKGEREKKGGLE